MADGLTPPSARTYQLAANATLFHADCRDALKALPSDCLDSCVTDPPYALVSIVKRFGGANAAPARGNDAYMRASAGFMGKKWDTGETAFTVEFWAEVYRVLKPGAHLVAFGGSRGYHRMAVAIEDAGFEIRDSLMFLYGTGFPKSHSVSVAIDKQAGAIGHLAKSFNMKGGGDRSDEFADNGRDQSIRHEPITDAAKEWDSWGTALKPAFEPIVLARKPLSEGTVAANVLRWRTGALNIGGCKIQGTKPDTTRGASSKASSMVGTLEAQGRILDDGLGRWPANICHDGSAEVVGAFPQSNGQLVDARSDGAPKTGNIYGKFNHRNGEASADRTYEDKGATTFTMKPGARRGDSGSAARFFFNTQESDAQWLAQNLPNDFANAAAECLPLQSEPAAFVLARAVEQSTPHWVLTSTDCQERSMSVTPSELRRISASVTETILSFDERCSPESLPSKRIRSDNLAEIAATREQIDTITITISLLKLNGSVAPATFKCTLLPSELGARDCAKRFHYSAKASKADRAGGKHPTVKPVSLMAWLARLVTPPGGTVLDPFAGSGTTGAACRLEGFNCILVEREAEYVADICARFADLQKVASAA